MKADDLVRDHICANVHPFIYPILKMDLGTACDLFDLNEDEYIALGEVRDYEQPVREWIDDLDDLEDVRADAWIEGEYTKEELLKELESECGWEDFAYEHCIDPHEHEVYEYWLVSDWLAYKFGLHGETVVDFGCGCRVWCRTTTGQAISMDYVIEKIAEETE